MFGLFQIAKRTTRVNEVAKKLTAQQTIDYKRIYDDGIMEVEKGVYSKSISFTDINYQVAKQADQEAIFAKYCQLLNFFDPSVELQVTINNRNIDKADFENDVLIKSKEDGLDGHREEYNNILKKQIQKGRNNITKDKYLTLKIRANSHIDAQNIFSRLENEVEANIKAIGSSCEVMTAEKRLQVLSDFFNVGSEYRITDKYKKIKKRGLATKDIIAPTSFNFSKDYFTMGGKFARGLFLKDMPSFLTDNFVSELTDFQNNMMLTINIKSVAPDKALREVEKQLTAMNANKIQQQKNAHKNNYGMDIISYDLQQSLEDAETLLRDLKTKNQKMFFTNLLIVHVADSLEELNNDTDTLMSIANKFVCRLGVLGYQQEVALMSTLPIGQNKIGLERTLTTESAGILIPFTSQELYTKGGIFYGVNAVSRNIISFDRKTLRTASGWILGSSGSGKSFAAKNEIINTLISTVDDIIVIDPQGEYIELAKAFGGEVISIASGTKNHINPLDMGENYGDDGNLVQAKSDFILSLIECLIGSNLTASEKSIIDRTLHRTYEQYINGGFKKEETPTLKDFLKELKTNDDDNSKKLALELEIYITGSLDIFANQTNINLKNRFTVFETKDLGKQLKSVGMLVILDLIWNRITENHKAGKTTWIYIDEIYLLFNNELSSNFLFELYKKVRKWGGIPTGITQNIEDLLISEQARRMLSNSDFIMLLNQAPSDRAEISKLLNVSDTQLSYVTNSGAGKGLIIANGGIIPFINDFPKNTKLYRLITTKPNEQHED